MAFLERFHVRHKRKGRGVQAAGVWRGGPRVRSRRCKGSRSPSEKLAGPVWFEKVVSWEKAEGTVPEPVSSSGSDTVWL